MVNNLNLPNADFHNSFITSSHNCILRKISFHYTHVSDFQGYFIFFLHFAFLSLNFFLFKFISFYLRQGIPEPSGRPGTHYAFQCCWLQNSLPPSASQFFIKKISVTFPQIPTLNNNYFEISYLIIFHFIFLKIYVATWLF